MGAISATVLIWIPLLQFIRSFCHGRWNAGGPFTGQRQRLWVRVACSTVFGQRFDLVCSSLTVMSK